MKYHWWLYLIYAVGLLLGLGPSYIHPDEHFQCIEILVMRFTNSKGTVPWEFDPRFAARSYVPLLLVYGPLFTILKIFSYFQNNPISILYLMRLQNYLMIILCGNYIIPKLIRGDTKAVQSIKKFLFLTSYVTWTYQTHTFSNSVETLILMKTLTVMESIADEKNTERIATRNRFYWGL